MEHNFQKLLYTTAEENQNINAILKDESIWMTQKSMAELFDCGIDNISIHLKNIYKEGELEEQRTIEKISIVQQEGNRQVNRPVTFYNLDAIISVAKAKEEYKKFQQNNLSPVEQDYISAIKELGKTAKENS